MTAFRLEQLNELTDIQLKELVDCCSKALRDNPAQRAFLGNNMDLIDDFMRVMLRATVLEGTLYVVYVREDSEAREKIVSTGSFFAEGKNLFGSEEQRGLGFYEFLQKLSPETLQWWTVTYPETVKVLDERLFTREEAANRCWCFNLATHPDYQRRGYATAIVNAAFEKTDSFLGLASATEINIKIFESMGFEEIGDTVLPASTGDITLTIMTKGRST